MQESLTLLAAHLSVGIAQNESNSGEEVTLARTITTNDNIVLWREGLDDGLVFVAARASCQKRSWLEMGVKSTHLLKPWIMICLICIVTNQAMPGI
jgi:hypothetical protein